MWSAGITRYDNVWLVLYARRSLSPNRCLCMKLACASFSIATTVNARHHAHVIHNPLVFLEVLWYSSFDVGTCMLLSVGKYTRCNPA